MKHASSKNRPARKREDEPYATAMSEQELSEWAGKSALLANEGYGVYSFGAALFWSVVAAILIARFLLIDPAKLRPSTAAATPPNISVLGGGKV